MNESVRVERRGAVTEITLDRPKANAIDVTTSRLLGEAFRSFGSDDGARVAIITAGGERFFSAGWDLKAAAAGDESAEEDYGPGGFAGLTEMHELTKPVVAAVNGYAAGGGFELALAADMIVAAEHAEMFLPEATVGIIPSAGGVLRLPRRLPRAIALEMMFTGRRMSAEEALRWGVVNAIVPAANLMESARELAGKVAGAAPLAVRAIKRVVDATQHMDLPSAYAAMRALPEFQEMATSEDAREGPRAFAEKRPPRWRGR